MSNWKDYFKRKKDEAITSENTVNLNIPATTIPPASTATLTSTISTSNISAMNTSWTYGTTYGINSVSHITSPWNSTTTMGNLVMHGNGTGPLISINSQSKEIVRINDDGSVVWNDGIQIDEAAAAFGRAISLGTEVSAGISKGAKLRMRDSIFSNLIAIAEEKGHLTAEDLTYLLEASKMVEKLKGDRE